VEGSTTFNKKKKEENMGIKNKYRIFNIFY